MIVNLVIDYKNCNFSYLYTLVIKKIQFSELLKKKNNTYILALDGKPRQCNSYFVLRGLLTSGYAKRQFIRKSQTENPERIY